MELSEEELNEAIKWFKEKWKEHIELETFGEKPEVRIVIGRSSFTPKEMLEQMERKTQIGLLNAKIIKEYLEWKKKGGEKY